MVWRGNVRNDRRGGGEEEFPSFNEDGVEKVTRRVQLFFHVTWTRNYQQKELFFSRTIDCFAASVADFAFESTLLHVKNAFEEKKVSEVENEELYRELAKKSERKLNVFSNDKLCFLSSFCMHRFTNFFMIQRIYKYYLHDSLDFFLQRTCSIFFSYIFLLVFPRHHLENSDFVSWLFFSWRVCDFFLSKMSCLGCGLGEKEKVKLL